MTVEEVLREVEEIRSIASDNEVAHSAEDSLWWNVLKDIAFGDHDRVQMQELAAAALKTTKIHFARWCA